MVTQGWITGVIDKLEELSYVRRESFIGVQIDYSGIGYASIDSMHSLVFGGQISIIRNISL